VIQGDAATLPFSNGAFSSAIAILMLHHLRSNEMQDRAFAGNLARAPAGRDIPLRLRFRMVMATGWGTSGSTFVHVTPASAIARLTTTGFSEVTVDFRCGGFRIRALRAREM